MRFKTLLSVTSETLRLFVNTSTYDHKCSCYKRENIPQAIQMQLSKKLKLFYEVFIAFVESNSISNILRKKMKLIDQLYLILLTPKDLVTKRLKGYDLWHPWGLKVPTGPKHWWNRNKRNFSQLFHFCGLNWDGNHSSW